MQWKLQIQTTERPLEYTYDKAALSSTFTNYYIVKTLLLNSNTALCSYLTSAGCLHEEHTQLFVKAFVFEM